MAVWRPRFQGAAQGFIAVERERRGDIERSYVETYGKRTFDAPGGDFVLSGQADRIDIRNDGKAAILDYKTGATPTRPQVEELLAPQLPLEAAILAEGGFPEIGKRLTEELIYLSLADGKKAANGGIESLADVVSAQRRPDGAFLNDFHGRSERTGTQQQRHIIGFLGRHAAADLHPSATDFGADHWCRHDFALAFFEQQNGHALANVFTRHIFENPCALAIQV